MWKTYHNEKIIMELETAINNRYKCTVCGGKITKSQKFFRDAATFWRASHTVNICRNCITLMMLKCGVTDDEIGQIKKQIILEKI